MSRRSRRETQDPHQERFSKKRNDKQDTTINLTDYKRFTKEIELIPRNIHQEDYIANLLDPSISIAFSVGPAGTGKTMLSVLAGIKMLKEGDITKIVITRPAVGVDNERHGFLPGDINQKMEPWTRPIFDVFHEHYTIKDTVRMLEEQIIEISPLAYMRGRTFKDSWIIADEMQNATPGQMKMLLTRLGEGSRMAVTGDVMQTDRKEGENGLIDFNQLFKKFGKSPYISWNSFTHKDIERHPAVTEVLRIYGDDLKD